MRVSTVVGTWILDIQIHAGTHRYTQINPTINTHRLEGNEEVGGRSGEVAGEREDLFVGASFDVDLRVTCLKHTHQVCLHLVLDRRDARLLLTANSKTEEISCSPQTVKQKKYRKQ